MSSAHLTNTAFELDERQAWVLAPLAGASLPSPMQVDDVRVSLLSRQSWIMIERRELIDEFDAPLSHRFKPIPYMIFEIEPLDDSRSAIGKRMVSIRAITLALRLLGLEQILEPELTCIYFRSGGNRRLDPGLNIRVPGPYRHYMYERHQSRAEMSAISPRIAEAAGALVPAIERLLRQADSTSLIPANLYRQSFQPYFGPGEQLIFLFASIEGLMLSWRERVAGTSLVQRLQVVKGTDASCATLDLEQLRQVRNRLAHGVPDPSEFSVLLPGVRALVGAVLLSWLEFSAVNGYDRAVFNEYLAQRC